MCVDCSSPNVSRNPYVQGLVSILDIGLRERFKRLREYIQKLEKQNYVEHYERFQGRIREPNRELGDLETRDALLQDMTMHRSLQSSYIDTIPTLPSHTRLTGTQWLQSIVDTVVAEGGGLMNPSD